MSVICPRCGYEDDGSSFNCPRCYAVLQPDLVPKDVGRRRVDAALLAEEEPGPVGRLLGRSGRRFKGGGTSHDTVPSAPAVGPDGRPRGPGLAGPGGGGVAAGSPGAIQGAPFGGRDPRTGLPYGVPARAQRPMGAPDPPTYLWQSILATLFCCMPFGIVAIVFSAMTMSALGRGNWADAVEHSNRARLWLWLAVLSGVVMLVLLVVRLCTGRGRVL